jgi:hypothetical protein
MIKKIHTIETDVGDVSHGVFNSPYNAVHEQFELWRCHCE